MSPFQSSFSSGFSLKELVQRNQSNSGLSCSDSAGGGGIGIVAGGGGIVQTQSSFHKGESCSCQISNTEIFDEAKFLRALKENIEKDLDARNAEIVSSKNPDATSFSIEYTVGRKVGRLEISGARSPGNYYSFQAQLDEKSDAKP